MEQVSETKERTYTFYSQQGEDVFVYRNFLNRSVDDGIFVDVGAYDGVQGSNTKFFEDVLGYRGVLIEPTQRFIPSILFHRPRSSLYNYAIHPTADEVSFIGDDATGGILSEMSPDHIRDWFPDHGPSAVVNVPAAPLGGILQQAGITHIDFLSIDVEGGERLVLESMDWAGIDVFVICIELDGTHPEKDAACRAILQREGFTFQTRVGNNDMWANLQYSKKRTRYSSEVAPYTAHFQYLNTETQRTLPELLATFQSPLDLDQQSSSS
jgi:FkbM family methyltransferase